MAPAGVHLKKDDEKGVGEVVSDLWQLCRDYAKQETIDPLKSIGRFLGWGLGGAVVLGLGIFFLGLGVLRALQTEVEVFDGGVGSVAPYGITLVLVAIAAVLALRAIKRPLRAEEKDAR